MAIIYRSQPEHKILTRDYDDDGLDTFLNFLSADCAHHMKLLKDF